MKSLSIRVWTFRQGLLARLGHDLCLTFSEGSWTQDDSAIQIRIRSASIQCLGNVKKNGRVEALSSGDRNEIENKARTDVLQCEHHPWIVWEGQPTSAVDRGMIRAEGHLQLAGNRRPLNLDATGVPVKRVEFHLQPSQWGIEPVRALGGALRLRDDMRIEVMWSSAWSPADPASSPSAPRRLIAAKAPDH